MINPMDWPLRTRIRQLAILPVLVITVLLMTYFLVERFSALSDELDARGETMARQLAPASEYGVISGNHDVLAGLLEPLLNESDVAAVFVRDAGGSVLVERYKPGISTLASQHGNRVRRYEQPILREMVAVDAMDALAGMTTSTAELTATVPVGRVEIVLVTDDIVAMQQEVLIKALLMVALVLAVTLLIASKVADAMAKIETARASAEHASRAKSEFLAMMSHELRTPMNGVLGMLELLEDTALDGDQHHYLDTARQSSEHLLVVIDDILDFSRIEGGRLALERIDFDLADFLEKTVDGFGHRAQSRDIALNLHLANGLRGLVVSSDPTRLRQVLVNLIGNAVKFTERGGVTVRAEGALVGNSRLNLRIFVEDTGIGIPADRIEQMFEPFRQADTSTSRRYGGTGLGLAIARRLTEMLGGELVVDSVVGVGTCFTLRIELPARSSGGLTGAEARAVVTVPKDVGLVGRRVLLVEDNPVSQMVAQGMLRSFGMEVDVADDGEAALAHLVWRRYDVILMDLHMPRLDGIATTRRLRAMPEKQVANTPVIAVTANVLAGERKLCLAAGMNDYLAKPYRRAAFRDALAKAVAVRQKSGGA